MQWGPLGTETGPKPMKKLMSTCNGGGCDFHSIQECSADRRLRGNRSLSFIGELRQEGMDEHSQGFERQWTQESASNGTQPINRFPGT